MTFLFQILRYRRKYLHSTVTRVAAVLRRSVLSVRISHHHSKLPRDKRSRAIVHDLTTTAIDITQILTEGREMSMMRLIYLVSVALNICGHMCLYCVVGEILVTQVSIAYTRGTYMYMYISNGKPTRESDNVSLSPVRSATGYITQRTITSGTYWSRRRRGR